MSGTGEPVFGGTADIPEHYHESMGQRIAALEAQHVDLTPQHHIADVARRLPALAKRVEDIDHVRMNDRAKLCQRVEALEKGMRLDIAKNADDVDCFNALVKRVEALTRRVDEHADEIEEVRKRVEACEENMVHHIKFGHHGKYDPVPPPAQERHPADCDCSTCYRTRKLRELRGEPAPQKQPEPASEAPSTANTKLDLIMDYVQSLAAKVDALRADEGDSIHHVLQSQGCHDAETRDKLAALTAATSHILDELRPMNTALSIRAMIGDIAAKMDGLREEALSRLNAIFSIIPSKGEISNHVEDEVRPLAAKMDALREDVAKQFNHEIHIPRIDGGQDTITLKTAIGQMWLSLRASQENAMRKAGA